MWNSNIKFNPLDIVSKFIMLLMFMGAMDFVTRNYYWVFIAFLLFFVFYIRKFKFDGNLAVLLFLAVSVLAFNEGYQKSFTYMLKPFIFPIGYCIGFNTLFASPKKNSELDISERNTEKVILIATLGSFAHFLLNAIKNIDSVTRNVLDYWTNQPASATAQAALATLATAVAAAYLFSRVDVKRKLFAILSLIFIVSYNLVLAGRTLFVLIIILLAFSFLHNSVIEKKKLVGSLLIVCVVCALLLTAYANNLWGIKTAIAESNFHDRFISGEYTADINQDSRLQYKIEYAKRLLDHPFGGRHIYAEVGHSAHDLYFDTYDESGVFAFVFVIAYVISSIYRMILCLKHKDISFKTKRLVACVYIAVNIIFWLEPIMRGMHWLLTAYCFIDGAVSRMLLNKKLEAAEKKTENLNEARAN